MTAPLPPHDACFDIGNGNHYYWRRDSVKLAVREALERLIELDPECAEARAMLEDYK